MLKLPGYDLGIWFVEIESNLSKKILPVNLGRFRNPGQPITSREKFYGTTRRRVPGQLRYSVFS